MSRHQTPDIYSDLRERLIEARFAPSEKLKPQEIQEIYGCSANTIRDVLFRLSAEGLADFTDQRGFRVPEMSVQKQHELTQMRILLEAEGTRLSMKNGGVEWESNLIAVHHKLLHLERRIRASAQSLDLLPLWLSAEEEFHQSLIAACGSDILKSTHRRIYAQFRQQLITTDRTFTFIAENIAQHQSILDAALEGDVDRVHGAIHDHLKRNLIPQDPMLATLRERQKREAKAVPDT